MSPSLLIFRLIALAVWSGLCYLIGYSHGRYS